MAVDDAGNIYVVWNQMNAAVGKSDGEVYLTKSTDEGGTWSSPISITQDTSDADQWLPWVTWDNTTNAIVVVYFDSRADADTAETYMAVSYDGGSSFSEDFKVSDVSWSGDCSPAGRAGDYISVAAKDGLAYPVWSDDRDDNDGSTFHVYVSPQYLWALDQTSVSHSLVNGPSYELDVTVDWETDHPAALTDSLILTSPTGTKYRAAYTAAGRDSLHEVGTTCTCETGTWSYYAKSNSGYVVDKSSIKTFKVNNCVD